MGFAGIPSNDKDDKSSPNPKSSQKRKAVAGQNLKLKNQLENNQKILTRIS